MPAATPPIVRIRLLTATAVTATLLVALAGCAAAPGATTTPTGSATGAPVLGPLECDDQSGSASDAVTATGAVGTAPDPTFAAPLSAERTEVTTVTAGDGDPVGEDVLVGIQYTLLNGTSGTPITTTGFGDGGATQYFGVVGGVLMEGMRQAVGCASVGSRVVAVVPPADAWGDQGNRDFGVAPGDSIVFVIDVIDTGELIADGTPQPPVDGMPAVTLGADGVPTVEIPDANPPADLKVAVLQQGSGAVVRDGDTVTVQYVGVNWSTGEQFDSSWSRGAVSSFSLQQVVPGFAQGLQGQRVGSQVIIAVPPELGYGDAGNGSTIGGDDTIVFVVDILATAPTPSAG